MFLVDLLETPECHCWSGMTGSWVGVFLLLLLTEKMVEVLLGMPEIVAVLCLGMLLQVLFETGVVLLLETESEVVLWVLWEW